MPPAFAAATQPSAPAGKCNLKTPSGLGYNILGVGTGATPVDADTVAVRYRGLLAADGKLFDESERADFGVGDVIPGFAEGLKLVKVGGRIRLCIPAALGYGSRATGSIPAGSDLVFEVDLLDIRKPPGSLDVADRICKSKTASGLGYTVVQAGAGGRPTDGDVALIDYKGYLAATGQPFDSANAAALPVNGVIRGFAEGLKLMERGGSYKLCIPSALGYGKVAAGSIPPDSELIFLIDLIDFKSFAEIQAMQAQPR
jgi:FKBP-type peptidyl-prolyl cis-trans isomerase FkpA